MSELDRFKEAMKCLDDGLSHELTTADFLEVAMFDLAAAQASSDILSLGVTFPLLT